MALPQDGQNANGLTKVTQIPAGKELMFIDPTTNEGGIITLEDLTKQILNGLLSQTFALDAGQKTIIQALNTLNSETPRYENANYRAFSDVITALNSEKDHFSTETSYILTANLIGGAPHLIVFGIDDTGYGAGLYVNYTGKISFFKIEKGSFYNF